MVRRFRYFFLLFAVASLFVGCGSNERAREAEWLNAMAYQQHYRNLDSVRIYAEKALAVAPSMNRGGAEALNNLAFVAMAKMDYARADSLLDRIESQTDHVIELLVADVQRMRLCQRRSMNKEFYFYRDRAEHRLDRLQADLAGQNGQWSEANRRRLVYAESEFYVVLSTYYYYVGLYEQSRWALEQIEEPVLSAVDEAQLLNYWYNIGAGGLLVADTKQEIGSMEVDYLLQTYIVAHRQGYPYFEAQALQSLADHLLSASEETAQRIAITLGAEFSTPLAIASRTLELFLHFGDVYQTAGAYRTLGECYWHAGDYLADLQCLDHALNDNPRISQAPDLVASIREQFSFCYAALNDKQGSDFNRNIYLDLQDGTRQDRQLEARAEELEAESRQLNIILLASALLLAALLLLLFLFDRLRRKRDRLYSADKLLIPLQQWTARENQINIETDDHLEELTEQVEVARQQVVAGKRRNIEQRAKVSLVGSVMPFIDRMKRELDSAHSQASSMQQSAFIAELADEIEQYNRVLTDWIQLRKGVLNLRIESFALQDLFTLLNQGKMAFSLKGINYEARPTSAWVKADKTLTLFMLNTIADNARKFTPQGGQVTIDATEEEAYVEIAITDTGKGLSPDEAATIFDRKITGGHGFGLMNCKGIIEQYKKVSRLFQVCTIGVSSEQGKGSRFFFRLPKGVARMLLALAMMATSLTAWSAPTPTPTELSDSIYESNIAGQYAHTISLADSCVAAFNQQIASQGAYPRMLLEADNEPVPAELEWFYAHLDVDYTAILRMRNEVAVAALALHEWSLYTYNNTVYTRLFREMSADASLGDYIKSMSRTASDKNVALVLLLLLLLSIVPAYYLLYYRHRLAYQRNLKKVNKINQILLNNDAPAAKLHQIEQISATMPTVARLSAQNTQLTEVVKQIIETLRATSETREEKQLQAEQYVDELRRLDFEAARLYVANSVTDNCLSTLKHETMYYPARIKALLSADDTSAMAVSDVVNYYQQLYSLLYDHVQSQAKPILQRYAKVDLAEVFRLPEPIYVLADKELLFYLASLLRKHIGADALSPRIVAEQGRYLTLGFSAQSLQLSPEAAQALFTPLTSDFDFMLCRQIVRDMGEGTHARGCGIGVKKNAENQDEIQITFARYGTI